MRVGLDFRWVTVGSLAINRGIGRYTVQQTRALLQHAAENDYVLFLYEGTDPSVLPADLTSNPSLAVAYLPRPTAEANAEPHVLRNSERLQEAISREELDLFHITTPCLLPDFVFPRFDVCPYVVTHYDLIPLVYPDHYFPHGPTNAPWPVYRRALGLVRRADALVAISSFGRKEAAAYLGFPNARMSVAPPHAADHFRPQTDQELQESLRALRRRIALRDRYIVSLTHLHHSKNIDLLLDGYASLPASLRGSYQLVLVGEFSIAETTEVRRRAVQRGIEGDIALTGLVTDEEVATLLSGAELLVHPSRYEGFGLPPLEAMACGTVPIALPVSALPEVVGDAGVLTRGVDPQSLAAAVRGLLEDDSARQTLAARGPAQAARFTSRRLAQGTLEAYQAALTENRREGPRPLRVAMWTPVPPLRTGISDYAQDLAATLAGRVELELFVADGFVPSAEVLDSNPVFTAAAFSWRTARDPFDVVLFQLGASKHHAFMVEAMERWPGVVTIHELHWGWALHAIYHENGDAAGFSRELAHSEGKEALEAYRSALRGPSDQVRERLEEFLSRCPMLRRVLESSRAVVTHVDGAADELATRYGRDDVIEFDMGVADPTRHLSGGAPNDARLRLGVDRETFLVGAFGLVDRSKRVHAVLDALASLPIDQRPSELVVVGEFKAAEYRDEIEERARKLGVRSRVHFTGRVARRDFELLMLACDVVANLRDPHRRQTSGTLALAVAAGKPVIVTEGSTISHYPDSFCVRVPAGPEETSALRMHLTRLASSPGLVSQMGREARAYYRRKLTLETMAQAYLDLFASLHRRRIVEVAQ